MGTFAGNWRLMSYATCLRSRFLRLLIPLHVERRDVAGDLLVTCFATLQPLIPDPTKFWAAV